MFIIACIATLIAAVLTILVLVYSERGTGYPTVYAAWIIAAFLWLAVAVR